MKEDVLISVIVPAYNVEQYLAKCLDSLVKQTYGKIEIIVVDDGSTDTTGNIADGYKKVDDRVSVIHTENKGLSAARNIGIAGSKGKYITFVDSDDYISETMLDTLYSLIVNHNADIACCSYLNYYCGDTGIDLSEEEASISILDGEHACRRLFSDQYTETIVAWGKLYKRDIWSVNFFPQGRLHEDEFVMYKVLYEADKIVFTNARLYYYTQRPSSISNNLSVRRLDALDAFQEAAEYYKTQKNTWLYGHAYYRYMKQIMVFYNAFTDNEIRERLEDRFKKGYKEWKIINDRFTHKAMLWLFYQNPRLYTVLRNFVRERVKRKN